MGLAEKLIGKGHASGFCFASMKHVAIIEFCLKCMKNKIISLTLYVPARYDFDDRILGWTFGLLDIIVLASWFLHISLDIFAR